MQDWAVEVKYVAENADLWADLQGLSAELQPVEEVPDPPFTVEEQAEIAEHLDRVKVESLPGHSCLSKWAQ